MRRREEEEASRLRFVELLDAALAERRDRIRAEYLPQYGKRNVSREDVPEDQPHEPGPEVATPPRPR